MASTPDLNLALRRLAETIAWCRLHVSDSNPSVLLRTPALRPANLGVTGDQRDSFDYEWGTYEDRRTPLDAVSTLAAARADLLGRAGAYSDLLPQNLAGGRLLIAMPHESDVCGLSEAETDGFIDAVDVPAWDSWVCYLQEPSKTVPQGFPRPFLTSYLLCWIPPQFLSLVNEGIKVNPTECFLWAVEYKRHRRYVKTALLRQLEAEGLLT